MPQLPPRFKPLDFGEDLDVRRCQEQSFALSSQSATERCRRCPVSEKKKPTQTKWESKVPPPKATPPINKALLRDY